MKKNSIAHVVIGIPVDGFFDYLVPDELIGKVFVGQRVCVPFGRKKSAGYIVEFSSCSDFSGLKALEAPLEDQPVFTAGQLGLGKWISEYYGCSWGEALEAMLPFAVRQKKTLALQAGEKKRAAPAETPVHQLFTAQDEAPAWQEAARQIRACLDLGRGVLLLAPDHLVAERISRFVQAALKISPARLDLGPSKKQVAYWLAARGGDQPCVLGLRSAVFAPVKGLGLAVMFNEHQYGYQEDQAPFYHAREVLLKRAAREGFGVIFVSAAPTVELWSAAREGLFRQVRFPAAAPAAFRLIDLANYKPQRESYLSIPLTHAVGETLQNGGRVLILYNRRGFNTLTKCGSCGHVIACSRCHVPYVYVYGEKVMRCPSCGGKAQAVKSCPECRQALLHYGEGIERIAGNLAKFFSEARSAVFDRDTQVVPEKANLIIATQAVLRVIKELNIDVAGVLDIDAALSRFDFRCQQKVFSLLTELRASVRGTVFVQTKNTGQAALACVLKNDPERFYQQEMAERKEAGFPPAKHLLAIILRGEDEAAVTAQAEVVHEACLADPCPGMDILPPQPDFQPKLRGKFRFAIMTKCLDVPPAVQYIKKVLHSVKRKRGVLVSLHVDP